MNRAALVKTGESAPRLGTGDPSGLNLVELSESTRLVEDRRMSWFNSRDDLWLLCGVLLIGAVWLTMASFAVFKALDIFYLTIGTEVMILGIGLMIEIVVFAIVRGRQ